MYNPMLSVLTRQTAAPVKQLINTLRASGNPQMLLSQMAAQNPQIAQVMQYVRSCGGDPRTAFYKLAQEKGVDPKDILSQLNG